MLSVQAFFGRPPFLPPVTVPCKIPCQCKHWITKPTHYPQTTAPDKLGSFYVLGIGLIRSQQNVIQTLITVKGQFDTNSSIFLCDLDHISFDAELSEADGNDDSGILYPGSPAEKAAVEEAKKERRRKKILKELFETEKAYLNHLELIHKVILYQNCYLPFPVSVLSCKVLTRSRPYTLLNSPLGSFGTPYDLSRS